MNQGAGDMKDQESSDPQNEQQQGDSEEWSESHKPPKNRGDGYWFETDSPVYELFRVVWPGDAIRAMLEKG